MEEKKENLDAAAILRMIPEIVNCAQKPLKMALGDLCLHHLQLYAAVARPDSAQAALDTQKLVSAVYTALAAAQNWIRVRHADIRLRPDFSGGEESSWAVRLRLSFHPHRDAGGGAAVCVLPAAAVAGAEEKGTAGRTGKTDSLRYGFIKIQKGMVV